VEGGEIGIDYWGLVSKVQQCKHETCGGGSLKIRHPRKISRSSTPRLIRFVRGLAWKLRM
jgi:hypothetical protein